MSIIKLRKEFQLYLFVIKEAFEAGAFAYHDHTVLKALFEQAMLYAALLEHEQLCTPDTLHSIAEFCKLLESELPAPNITDTVTLSFQLGSPPTVSPFAALSVDTRKKADDLYRVVMVNLMSVFHMAVYEITYRLKNSPLVTEADTQNALYVIGMSEITVRNFETATAQCGNLADRDYDQIHKFFADGTRFAASLQRTTAGAHI